MFLFAWPDVNTGCVMYVVTCISCLCALCVCANIENIKPEIQIDRLERSGEADKAFRHVGPRWPSAGPWSKRKHFETFFLLECRYFSNPSLQIIHPRKMTFTRSPQDVYIFQKLSSHYPKLNFRAFPQKYVFLFSSTWHKDDTLKDHPNTYKTTAYMIQIRYFWETSRPQEK